MATVWSSPQVAELADFLVQRRRQLFKQLVVIDVQDEFCPWNTGRWYVGADGVGRTENGPDLRCRVSDLGSVYLGGFTWNRLSQALRVEELTPGAAGRADAIFRTAFAPWCPEIF
jgi:hypothetical protein